MSILNFTKEKNNMNYLVYTRTEMYYNCILPISEILQDSSLSTEDKLISINALIDSFHKNDKIKR
jgi:hypothetical protein